MLRQVRDLIDELRNPDVIVASYLSSQEEVYYDDPPAITSFLLFNGWEVALAAALFVVDLGLAIALGFTHWSTIVVFLAADYLLVRLVAERFQQLFTRYVLTSFRVMRISGVLSRNSFSIPWSKITDIKFSQSLVGRYLGYANVRIESANEASGLQELRGLKNPLQFHRLMLEMVAAKQGHTSPESGDVPLAKFEPGSDARRIARNLARLRAAEPTPPSAPPRPRWRGTRPSHVQDPRGTVEEGTPVPTAVGAAGDDGLDD